MEKVVKVLIEVCSVLFALALLAGIVSIFTGCSHNVVTYSDGIGFETTFRPDTGNFGFIFRYGKILNATVRENTEVEMSGNGNSGGNAGSAAVNASNSGNVKIKVGRQITGYYTDALKAGATPEQLKGYLDGQKDGAQK